MEPRKAAILGALYKFVRQRPGLDFRNYGDGPTYRAEQRSITRDLHDYRKLERAIAWRDGITADDLLQAAQSAYSGRLTITPPDELHAGCMRSSIYSVDYCTGAYWPTEYRRAACAVLSAAIWAYTRANMPEPIIAESGDRMYPGKVGELISAGTWIRRKLRAEFGTHLARRWFDWDGR